MKTNAIVQRHKVSLRFISCSSLLSIVLVMCLCATIVGANEVFEIPPVFRTSDLLPPDALEGPDHEIYPYVYNDGINNIYELDTTHGPLKAESTALLNIRLNELDALQKLEKAKRTTSYAKALANAAAGPLRLTRDLIIRPVSTVSGVVTGVGSYFRNIGYSIYGSKSEQEGGFVKEAIMFSNAKRMVAGRVGVDPYSSYQPLQERLNSISWAAYAGGITTSVLFMGIPGTTGTAISGTNFGSQMNERILTTAPADLKKLNAKLLGLMDVHKSVARVFLDHPKYTPTRTTYVVGSLELMNGVADRSIFIERASLAQDESVAFYFEQQVELMAGYHGNVTPVAKFVEVGGLPFLQTQEGTIVGIFPCDHIAWTEDVAARAYGNTAEAVKTLYPDITGKELWFEGTVSNRARESLERMGWKVKEKTGQTLLIK